MRMFFRFFALCLPHPLPQPLSRPTGRERGAFIWFFRYGYGTTGNCFFCQSSSDGNGRLPVVP